MMMCGADRVPGSSYCVTHLHRCQQGVPVRREVQDGVDQSEPAREPVSVG